MCLLVVVGVLFLSFLFISAKIRVSMSQPPLHPPSSALALVLSRPNAASSSPRDPQRSSSLSSSRAKYALVPADQPGHAVAISGRQNSDLLEAATLSPRHLRDISKFVDSNIRLGHAHRSTRLPNIIPKGPFVKIRDAPGDTLLQISLAPIHPNESALDVPLRLTCPEDYHCPIMVDPRSQGTIASRIVSLLKGAACVPVHWEGETQGAERDVTKLNAIRDSEIRASAANRAQHFAKEARAHVASGSMYYNCGNLDKAIQSFSTAVQRFEVVGNAQGVAYCHNILGVCHYRRKEYKSALVHHKKQQALSAEYGKAVAQINLGVSYSALNELTFAEQAFSDALTNAMTAQDAVLETIALGNLGLTYMRLGEVRKSQTNLEQCLEHCSVAGDRVGSAVCLLLLGEIYSIVDDTEHALFYFEHAFRVAGEASVKDLQEIARVSVGIAKGTQNAKASMTLFAQRLGKDVGMADVLLSLPQ